MQIDSIVDLTGKGLESADLAIYFDAQVFEVRQVTLGSSLANKGVWTIAWRACQIPNFRGKFIACDD